MNFSQKFKSVRKSKKLTQGNAAAVLGVHRNTVLKWELGTHLPASPVAILNMLERAGLKPAEDKGLLVAECYSPEGLQSIYYKDDQWNLYKSKVFQVITSEEAMDWLEERGRFDALREYFGNSTVI